jgi:hypothetical protein
MKRRADKLKKNKITKKQKLYKILCFKTFIIYLNKKPILLFFLETKVKKKSHIPS